MHKFLNIKEQIREIFFVEPSAVFQKKILMEFYDYIFPDKNAFEHFLASSGRDNMYSAAKKIVNRILFDEPFNGTQFLLENLMGYEENHILKEYQKYTPQDHAIHSVSIYLLGIYLYFNHTVFHNSLLNFFLEKCSITTSKFTREQQAFLDFLGAWKGFSFLHDIAYPLEETEDLDGVNAEIYKELNLKTTEYTSTKLLSKILLFSIIINNTGESLNGIIKSQKEYFSEFETVKNKDNPIRDIERISENFYKSRFLHSLDDFYGIQGFLNLQKYFIAIKDEKHNYIAIYNFDETKSGLYYHRNYTTFSNLATLNHKRGLYNNYSIDFFLPDDKDQLFLSALHKLSLKARYDSMKEMGERMQMQLSNDLANMQIYSNLFDIEFLIYNEIMASYFDSFEHHSFFDYEKELLKEVVIEMFDIELKNVINKNLDDLDSKRENKYEFSDNELKKIINNIRDHYIKWKSNGYDDFQISCLERFKENRDEKEHFAEEYRECYSKVKNLILCSGKTEFNLELYQENLKSLLENNEIKKYLLNERFGTKYIYETFKKYEPKNSKYDHGIMAAIIIKEFIENKKTIQNYLNKKISMYEENQISDSAIDTMIYSILIHNVYTDRYEELCGEKPLHSLLLNPFSYFAMFCDNLQIWDRDKRVNHGLSSWEGYTVYGEDIGIDFVDDKIRVTFKTSSIINAFKKFKDSLEDYLSNASKLISISLIENN